MPSSIRSADLNKLSQAVALRLGLWFPSDRYDDLKRGVAAAAQDLGFPDGGACLQHLLSNRSSAEHFQVLAEHLTVGETYFFRDKAVIENLRGHILPTLIAEGRCQDRQLRLWSAGCCTGEEAYTLAILLDELIPDLESWSISILATDVNRTFLRRAEQAVYSEWSFRDVSSEIKQRYFTQPEPQRYRLKPRVRRFVRFRYLNLAQASYPSETNGTANQQLILCRNVLMYLQPETVDRAVRQLRECLVPGGWLITSPAEAPVLSPEYFRPADLAGGACFCPVSEPEKDCQTGEIREGERPSHSPGSVVEEDLPAPVEFPFPEGDPHEGARSLPDDTADAGSEGAPSRRLQRAREAFAQGCYEQVQELLQPVVSDLPDEETLEGMTLLAHSFANVGELAQAEHWCRRAIEQDKLNPTLRCLHANILLEAGRPEAGKNAFRAALYLDDKHLAAHFGLATLAFQESDRDEAGRHLRRMLELLESMDATIELPELDGVTVEYLAGLARTMLHGNTRI